jgi:hypothetical protein
MQLYATICSFYLPLIVMVVLYTKIYITARGIIEKVKRGNTTLYLSLISMWCSTPRFTSLLGVSSKKVKYGYTIFNLPIIKE